MDKEKNNDGLTHTQKKLFQGKWVGSGNNMGLTNYSALSHPGNRSPRTEITREVVNGEPVFTIFIDREPRGW